MTALADATIEQVDALGALTDSLVEIDRTISMLQAARDGMLAVGTRLALQVAEEAGQEDFGDLTTRAVAAAEYTVFGPAALVHGAHDRVTAMARTLHDAGGDSRTLDELRCDLTLDLLLTGGPAGHDTPDGLLAAITGTVSVTVPVTTLMGHDTAPAELDGRTPIDTATAKTLAGAASGWDRILTHPVTGAVLAVDRYRPTADLKRHLHARDQRCRFPGCGQHARDSDLDHTQDAAHGGPTTATNLGALCRRHHTLKHHTPWQVEHLHGGLFAWTSPTGKTYIDKPPPPNTVTFTEDQPPPF